MTIKGLILQYLKDQDKLVAGGIIEDYVRDLTGTKASTASRRCRDLEGEGKIEKEMIKGNVWYRVKSDTTIDATMPPKESETPLESIKPPIKSNTLLMSEKVIEILEMGQNPLHFMDF